MARAPDVTRRAAHEGETLEFKAQWTDRVLEDLAAFANHLGGTVVVGIADDGAVVGFPRSDKELQRIANQVVDTLGMRPQLRTEKRGGKAVLSIRAKASVMPVACRGRYLVRVGSVNREMTPDQIARRFVERLGQTWDVLPSPVKATEIDPKVVRDFVRLARARLPAVKENDPPRRVLQNLELIHGNSLTNGGALLFARKPQQAAASRGWPAYIVVLAVGGGPLDAGPATGLDTPCPEAPLG